MVYFGQLTNDIEEALSAGGALEETLQRTPMGEAFPLPPSAARAPLMERRPSYNVRRTYPPLAPASPGPGSQKGRKI